MNTRLISTASDVLHAAMERGTQTAAGLAYALESAQLLQSPETAAELSRLRSDRAEDAAQFEEYRGLVATLRARVAELEAERGSLVAARDAQIIAWLGKKAREYGTSNRESRDKAEAVSRMADKLSRGAVRQPLDDPPNSPLPGRRRLDKRAAEDAEATFWQRLGLPAPAAPVEDPHDSPLHHTYRLGHDLPEARNA